MHLETLCKKRIESHKVNFMKEMNIEVLDLFREDDE